MIDNYAGEEDTGLTEALANARAEKERILRARARRAWHTLAIGLTGIALLAWFDWRVGVGAYLLSLANSRVESK